MSLFNLNKRRVRKLRRCIRRNKRHLKFLDTCIARFESEIAAEEASLKDARKMRSKIMCETDQLCAELRNAEENDDA